MRKALFGQFALPLWRWRPSWQGVLRERGGVLDLRARAWSNVARSSARTAARNWVSVWATRVYVTCHGQGAKTH
eukprot:10307548-Alexandrium_andersonii.AAC.1